MEFMTQLEVIGEVALAMLLGGLIGFEREIADKPAGFRTQMLVAGSAALLVGLADALLYRFLLESNARVTADPIRIVEAIVTGISFLGAGTIFRSGRNREIEGLTTAASILLCAAIGISVALRQFVIAGGVTLLSLIVLRVLAKVEDRIAARKSAG
jgi:putative Mg2+ transporter-C (MgtC) family protein